MLHSSDFPELEGMRLASVTGLDELARASAKFTLPENRFHRHESKAKDARSRRGIKKLIQPENARCIVPLLPGSPDERLHCVLRGDFVLCELIPLIIAHRGACSHLRVATLGLSAANAEQLANLFTAGLIGELTIVASHYFQQVDKTTTYRQICAILAGKARIVITRSHAKVILLPTAGGDHYIIEGSANLRSSDNLEQMLILNDQETHDFHAGWIDDLARDHAART
ncbi:MAG: hypothetical protein Q8M07_17905 [Prosthecobacter sp.]|nr:hypothetical protein [Prosthecobacter sp.]